jgi:hypothetical protein
MPPEHWDCDDAMPPLAGLFCRVDITIAESLVHWAGERGTRCGHGRGGESPPASGVA